MADPITVAIASAVAGKAAESFSGQTGRALAAVVQRIRDKFRGHPTALAALDRAEAEHGDVSELAALIDQASSEDPEFGRQIRALWNQSGLAATDEGVVNFFHGHAEKVVQLRDLNGDLTIN